MLKVEVIRVFQDALLSPTYIQYCKKKTMLLGAPFDCGDKTCEKSILWALDDSKINHAQD